MSSVYSSKATTVWQLPLQVDPFPVNPFLQEHMKEPSVLTQSAFSSHVFATRHSSTSNEEQKISFFLYISSWLILFIFQVRGKCEIRLAFYSKFFKVIAFLLLATPGEMWFLKITSLSNSPQCLPAEIAEGEI